MRLLIATFALLILACRGLAGEPPGNAGSAFPTGKTIERVVTLHDGSQSYALYLPKAYTPDKKWPILYGFSPAARGVDPVILFRNAAEKYGWIVAGSNNSRNGPHEPIQQAIDAMLKDTEARLSIDPARRYATGFSGGARVAFSLAAGKGFAGVIPCGAGMASYMKPPENGSALAVAAIVGDKDFNYQEMLRLEETLDGIGGIRHRLAVFDGEHRWPPPDLAESAVRYMEIIRRMAKGPATDEETTALFLAEAAAAEKQAAVKGQYLRGHRHLTELAAMAKGTAAEKPLAARLAILEASDRLAREKADFEAFRKLRGEHAEAEKSDEAFVAAMTAFRKFAEEHKESDAGMRAAALVAGMGYRMAMGGAQLHQAGRYAEAVVWLRRARLLYPADAQLAYNLACAQARTGAKDAALKTLADAIDLGFRDKAHIEKDPDWDSLRSDPAYRKILEKLTASPKPTQ